MVDWVFRPAGGAMTLRALTLVMGQRCVPFMTIIAVRRKIKVMLPDRLLPIIGCVAGITCNFIVTRGCYIHMTAQAGGIGPRECTGNMAAQALYVGMRAG
jgi:hypothetical protein